MSFPKISFCLISKDNENTIRATLESIKKIADEIIVVDTGSKDNTCNIAQEYTDKLSCFKWVDDFAKARNESISYAQNDWVFIIDTDEVLVGDSRKLIEKAIKRSKKEQISAYECQIQNIVNNKVVSINYMARLIRKITEAPYTGRIHERLMPEYKAARSPVQIEHYGYDPSINSAEKQQLREKLLLLDHKERPKDINSINNLAAYYSERNRYSEALGYVQEALEIDPENNELLLKKAELLFSKDQSDKALQVLEPLVNKRSEHLDLRPYLLLGKILFKLEKHKECLQHYLNVFKFSPEDIYKQDLASFRIFPYFYSLFQACYLCSKEKLYDKCYLYGQWLLESDYFTKETIHLLLITALEAQDKKKIIELYEKHEKSIAKLPQAEKFEKVYLELKGKDQR